MSFFRRLLGRPLDEAESHYRNALRFRDRKSKDYNFQLSIWHFKQAIHLEPSNPVFHYYLGRAYAAAPLLAISRGANAGFRLSDSAGLAIAELKEAIRLRPNYPEAFVILGEAYMYLGEKEKALQAFQTVQQLSKNKLLCSYVERESQQVEQGISKEPQPAESRRHLEQAVIYRDLGKHRQAHKELDKAIKLAPDWPWLYDNLCKVG